MRTPRTLAAITLSLTALSFTPALADEQPVAETVDITVDLDAPASEIYRSIREQAWSACKPEIGSHYLSARTTARRECQKDLIADVVNQLPAPSVVRLATRDGIRTES